MKKESLTGLLLVIALGVTGRNVVGSKGDPKVTFTENKGQVCDQNYKPRPDILFSGSADGLYYHLSRSGASYQMIRVDSWEELQDQKGKEKIKSPDQLTIYRVDINWVEANLNSKIVTGNVSGGTSNYYLGQCPSGVFGVKSFDQVTFQSIYSGIDLKWYGKKGELEYDFILKPYADPSSIKMQIKGFENLKINSKGELEIKTPLGVIIEQAPVAFQNNKQVSAGWKITNNIITIELGDYDMSQELIIDPLTRTWGTYYGGNQDDNPRACRADANGNVFMSGYTASASTTLIATTGSYQTNLGGNLDAFIVKFDKWGVRQWGTYYGGTAADLAIGSDIDTNGDVFLSGYSSSTGTIMATAGSHQSTHAGQIDAFLAKFDQNGMRIWATYYGTATDDPGYGCAVDPATNDVYLAGTSGAGFGIATPGSHQTTYGGGDDAYIVKFNSSGVRQWCTYYGGSLADNGYACFVDGVSKVILVGRTQSSGAGIVATVGSHQTTLGGGFDGFIVQFNSNGVRQWGTYYGGSAFDAVQAGMTDASGNIYVVGDALSNTPAAFATAGTHQTTFGGGSEAFIAKFNSSGVRQWGTYYGGPGNDYGFGCALDYNGNIIVSGSTTSTAGIASAGAYQSTLAGINDVVLANFNAANGQRIWGTYYGAPGGNTISRACATDNDGYIYLSGHANSGTAGTVIATSTSHQPTKSALYDGFLVQFTDCSTTTVSIVGSSTLCSGQNGTLTAVGTGFTSYLWNIGPPTATNIVTPSVTTIYTVTAGTGPASCDAIDAHTITVTQTPTLNVNSSPSVICVGAQSTLSVNGASTYSWNTNATTSAVVVSPSVNTTYTVTGYNGTCIDTKTVAITMTANISLSALANPAMICINNQATLNANGATTYTWNTSSNSSSIIVSPSVTTTYTVDGLNGTCTGSAVVTLSVDPCTVIKEHEDLKKVVIYPNPNNGNFTLIAPGGTYQLTNLLGQVVECIEVSGDEQKVNLEDLPMGVYYLANDANQVKLKIIVANNK